MLSLAYDDLAVSDGAARAKPNGATAGRFAAGWLLRLALLRPDRLTLVRTDDAVLAGRPFVYPLELTRAGLASFSAGAPGLDADLPPAVLEQARRGRAVILVWLGHDGGPLELDPAGTVWLYDVIELLIIRCRLPRAAVWLVTGAVAARDGFADWLRARGLYLPEVVELHPLTIFPAFAQAIQRAQAQGWDVACAPDGADGAVRVQRVAAAAPDDPPRDRRFTCVADAAVPHHRLILSSLLATGQLDDSQVACALAPPALDDALEFPDAGMAPLQERLRAAWTVLRGRLPLRVEPPTSAARSQLALVLAPALDGDPSVDARLMEAILNRQPVLQAGPPDSLRHLRALGFESFGRVIDESYDKPDTVAARMIRLLGAIEALGRRSLAELADLRAACRPALEHNRAHLIEGRHQLDTLLRRLDIRLGTA